MHTISGKLKNGLGAEYLPPWWRLEIWVIPFKGCLKMAWGRTTSPWVEIPTLRPMMSIPLFHLWSDVIFPVHQFHRSIWSRGIPIRCRLRGPTTIFPFSGKSSTLKRTYAKTRVKTHQIVRDAHTYDLFTLPDYKWYHLVYNEGVIDPVNGGPAPRKMECTSFKAPLFSE